MKNPGNSAKLLDLPYAPEADALLDELERSGQFRVGVEAEVDDENDGGQAASNDYSWGRGSGSVVDPGLVDFEERVTARGTRYRPRTTWCSRASRIPCWCAPATVSTAWCSRDISA